MTSKKDLGNRGEDMAVDYLVAKGYAILDRNWRSGHKEIDIVARDGDVLVAVEVKTRKTDTFGEPELAVGALKQRKLMWAMDAYMRHHGLDLDVRFDIVSIIVTDSGRHIEHLEDAFIVT